MGIFDFLKPLSKLKRLKMVLAPFEFVGKKVAILVNYALLTIVYFTTFAVTAVIAKIFRKRFLELKPDHGMKSYWAGRKKEDSGKKEAYRAF
ncbi:hypothetical protein HYY73_06290 [Candidatus Woesearchaeota archaeon]|nr:hypothetical protein [Candidatus Woesearchaeota archaeon]